jgi:signal peptidase I
MKDEWKQRCYKIWKEWARPFLIIVIIGTSLRSAVADWNYVPTGSMKPTIMEGDRIFVNRVAYDLKIPFTTWHLAEWADPKRGEIIVLISPGDGKLLVKRLIGEPGDRIELVDNELLVNGEPATYASLDAKFSDEISPEERPAHRFAAETLGDRTHPVMITPDRYSLSSFGPVIVPSGQYFVMGDNRDNSLDSRWIGFVKRRLILGRATAVAMSVDPNHYYLPRWHRFFRNLP